MFKFFVHNFRFHTIVYVSRTLALHVLEIRMYDTT